MFGDNTGATTIAIFTANGYNSVEYTWVAGATFKIGDFGAAVQSSDPVNFSVPVQVVDGDGDTAPTAPISVTLLPPAGPPTLDLDANDSSGGGSDYTSTFTIGGPAIPIADIDVLITDPNSAIITSATISMIANDQVPPNDTLSISGILPGGITASAYNPATGVLTLTGVASIADYQTALHQIVFSTADPLSNTDRIISVTVNDLTHTSNTAQTFLHVVENVPTPGTAAAAVDDDGLAGGNAASTAGDLDANVGDADGAASSEATFSGVLGGSVGNDVPGTFSFAALAGTTAAVGLETVTYSWTAGSAR